MRWDTPNGHLYACTMDLQFRGWTLGQIDALGPADIRWYELARRCGLRPSGGNNRYWLWERALWFEATMDADELAKERKKWDEKRAANARKYGLAHLEAEIVE